MRWRRGGDPAGAAGQERPAAGNPPDGVSHRDQPGGCDRGRRSHLRGRGEHCGPLEGLAEAGGICISGSAFEQIENKIPLRYDYLGEHEVKNIARPVRVYRALMDNGVVKEKEQGPRCKAQGEGLPLLAWSLRW